MGQGAGPSCGIPPRFTAAHCRFTGRLGPDPRGTLVAVETRFASATVTPRNKSAEVDARPAHAQGDRRALAVIAFMGFALLVSVALPVGAGLFLGVLLAFTLEPVCESLTRRTRRPRFSALACAVVACVVVCAGLGSLVYLLAERGAALTKSMPGLFGPSSPVLKLGDMAGQRLGSFGIRSEAIVGLVHDSISRVGVRAAELGGAAATLIVRIVVGVMFMTLTTYFMLRNSCRIADGMQWILPLEPRHTQKLLEEARSIGRGVIAGTVVIGLAQGLLAGVGYALMRAPQPAFFGAMTAVASTLPGVGTLFVWIPLGVYLLASGHVAAGIGLLLWGALLVVGLCDIVLRPLLVGNGSRMTLLPTLIGLFGGIELFGFIGLLLGPVMIGMGLAALRLFYWSTRRAAPRALSGP
jgi:predicted PurR-regulated permease PerM